MIVFLRTALAALVLVPFALDERRALGLASGKLGRRRRSWRLLQVAAPFMLISFGQEHISSSLAGILVATAPIFTFLLAIWISQEERAQGIGPAWAWASGSSAWCCCWDRRGRRRRGAGAAG